MKCHHVADDGFKIAGRGAVPIVRSAMFPFTVGAA